MNTLNAKSCKVFSHNVFDISLTWTLVPVRDPHESHCLGSPLSCPEVARWAAAQVPSVGVGAAVVAGVLRVRAFVDVRAAAAHLLKVEAVGADAAEAAQGVVAGSAATDLAVLALVLIWNAKADGQGCDNPQSNCPHTFLHITAYY